MSNHGTTMRLVRHLSVLALIALCGAAPAPLRLAVTLQRHSLDPLASIGIAVSIDNPSKHFVALHLPSVPAYRIEILAAGHRVWSNTTTARPLALAHTRTLRPGINPLVTYEWNGVLTGGVAPHRETYLLRVRIAGDRRLVAQQSLRFASPLPISALAHMRHAVVTIAGTLSADGLHLRDAGGRVRLSRRIIGVAPASALVVRGTATAPHHRLLFDVRSWAYLRAQRAVPTPGRPAAPPTASAPPHRRS